MLNKSHVRKRYRKYLRCNLVEVNFLTCILLQQLFCVQVEFKCFLWISFERLQIELFEIDIDSDLKNKKSCLPTNFTREGFYFP